ncbi:MAG: hypothetical protein IPJ31_01685 [Bacteroidetes bacterium]|nr:hypothetical protein [Bacteroidota bacterium]
MAQILSFIALEVLARHLSTKLIMGAGGGGPQSDNGQQVYNGGNGGAIVFIKANEIIGNGLALKMPGNQRHK